jgi:PAS domain S-box-containing protein/putative nucleotidyltransferase with HDIG domain
MIADVNPYLIKMLGFPRQEFVEKRLSEVAAFKDFKANQEDFEALQENEYIHYENLPLRMIDGHLIQVEFVGNVYMVGDEKVVQCNIRVINDLQQIMLALQNNERKYHNLVNQSPEGVFIIGGNGRILTVNKAICEQLGYDERELLSMSIWELIPEHYLARYRQSLQDILEGIRFKEALEYTLRGKDNKNHYVEILSAPYYSGKYIVGFQGIARDITERKQAEARIQRQLEHLSSLSTIDRVILANFDLKLSLSQILAHVTTQLGIDAADILILNPDMQFLKYGAGHGFRKKALQDTQIRLGESYAGRVVVGRQLIQISNLRTAPQNSFLVNLLNGEDFACYYGVPLITKGQVIGVLEIYHRAELRPDPEWFDFLNTLAAQTALALEIPTLFESLQRSNAELTLAYDETIVGWSHALDLRDRETEGHTQRVTELTVKLARLFGLSEMEQAQVRWGALLHDIGKMAIPDEILHKPGPLTDEEWGVMKKHPSLAYEMLAPIHFLRQALDIPYCHHEKWDGSGYPRGLRGNQIPLEARIFAVADVWDALRSDRPYRAAWAEEKVLEEICASSGTFFDPRVVDVFAQLPDKT